MQQQSYRILKNNEIRTKGQLLLNSITKYFNTNNEIYKMINIVAGDSNISLSVIDWFVTNYAKKNNIVYEIYENGRKKHFNVYLEYKAQLKAYSKQYFDPFCRKERVSFCHDRKNNQCIVTTIGQLNFFKWSLSTNIISYVINNFDDIYHDMVFNKKRASSESTTSTSSSGRKIRQELSSCATRGLNKHNVPVILTFR